MTSKSFIHPRRHDRAVAHVVGVILMIAITVVLAALIGAFVIDLGADLQETPNTNFDFDADPDEGLITITHASGDTLEERHISVLHNGTEITGDESESEWEDEITAGDTFVYSGDPESVSEGDEVQIVWASQGDSTILATFEVD